MKRLTAIIYALTLGALFALLFGCGGAQTPYDPIIVGTTGSGDFAMAIAPASQTISAVAVKRNTAMPGPQGRGLASAKKYTVTITAANDFTGTVNLGVQNPNGAGFTASLDKMSVTLTPGASQTATLTLGLSSQWDQQFGTFMFPVTGDDGRTKITQNATLVVTKSNSGADFSIIASPPKQTMQNGGAQVKTRSSTGLTAIFIVSVTPSSGFTGTVNLSVQNPNPQLFSATFDSNSLVINSASQQQTNLRITRLTTTSITGDQNFIVTGQSGSLSHTATATVTLQAASPAANYAIFSTGPVTVSGSTADSSTAANDGNVYGNGTVSIIQASSVLGFVQSTANIVVSSNSSVTGASSQNITALPPPHYDTQSAQTTAAMNGVTNGDVNITGVTKLLKGVINGNVTIKNSTVNVTAPLYITGNLTIDGSTVDPTPIIVQGTVTINNSTVDNNTPLAVVCLASGGAMTVTNSTVGGVIFCPNGSLTITGSTTAAVAANGVTVNNSTVTRADGIVYPLQ